MRAVCRRCSGRCCTNPSILVALDYEQKARKLSQYRHYNSHVGGFVTSFVPLLMKDPTGACVYFDRKTRSCGIYDRRPLSCRAWFCGRGTKHNGIWLKLKKGG